MTEAQDAELLDQFGEGAGMGSEVCVDGIPDVVVDDLHDLLGPPRLIDPAEPPSQDDGLRAATSRLAGRVDRLLSARFLQRFDATVDVHAA